MKQNGSGMKPYGRYRRTFDSRDLIIIILQSPRKRSRSKARRYAHVHPCYKNRSGKFDETC